MKSGMKLFLNSDNGEAVFGSGKWKLLAAIDELGSIQKAAESLDRSYRKAWGDIKSAESGFGKKLVVTVRGGRSGGETKLTEFGKQFLNAWNSYYLSVDQYVKNAYNENLSPVLNTIKNRVDNT
ncbi:MAG: LysR family transcriptional regulator [Fibrobacter sp.]|mgnify:CR=1 FL=1|nr:LysR family transcriptional regulator [Fibrobacter sp.]